MTNTEIFNQRQGLLPLPLISSGTNIMTLKGHACNAAYLSLHHYLYQSFLIHTLVLLARLKDVVIHISILKPPNLFLVPVDDTKVQCGPIAITWALTVPARWPKEYMRCLHINILYLKLQKDNYIWELVDDGAEIVTLGKSMGTTGTALKWNTGLSQPDRSVSAVTHNTQWSDMTNQVHPCCWNVTTKAVTHSWALPYVLLWFSFCKK